MLNTFSKPAGFTLVEVIVVIAIIGIAVTMGIPSYKQWVQNTQIRNAAESIQGGLQRARAEAIGRNENIEFVLGTNPRWIIKIAGAGGAEIERASNEGTKNVASSGFADDGVTAADTVTFNSLGAVGVPPNQPLNTNGSVPLRQIILDTALLDPADSRDLWVTVGIDGVGSNVRICDPNLVAGTSPRAC